MQLIMMHTSNWCFFSSFQDLKQVWDVYYKTRWQITFRLQDRLWRERRRRRGWRGGAEGLEGEEEGPYELAMLHTIKVNNVNNVRVCGYVISCFNKIVGLCNLVFRMQSTNHTPSSNPYKFCWVIWIVKGYNLP